MVTKHTKVINGVEFTLETGRLAKLTQASVLARAGDTVVLSTIAVGVDNPELDYFPLGIEYVEKLYAAGMISSSRFIKREGRPTEKEILSGRLMDHAIRSLFPEDLVREVQVITQVLAYDQKNNPELLQFIAASAALMISGIPFKGPVAAVRVGKINDELVYFPTDEQMNESSMNLIVSIIDGLIVSVEADGKIISEDILNNALRDSLIQGKELLDFQNEFVSLAGKKDFTYTPRIISTELKEKILAELGSDFEEKIFIKDKNERHDVLGAIKSAIHAKFDADYKSTDVEKCFDDIIKEIVRRNAVDNKKRIDGRAMDELRPISAEVGVLPRVHGSAIFNRGETQVLSVVTLGSSRLEQIVEGLEGEGTKRYMHHYNFPQFSVGEVDRKFGMANRRAIGHGIIGEKSILQVLPGEDNFKYTVRVVSEVLGSNGSTSMAATCGSMLALLDAGVKLEEQIAGISMGLIYEGNGKYVLFTDIIGDEDHYGDMDFKITGTRDGWTAIQLDNKLQGIPVEILIEAVAQSKKTRIQILDYLLTVINAPREELSQFAPRITTIKINPSKIGDVIGPGGKVIKEIIAQSGAEIDIEDDGSVNIAASSEEASKKAIVLIKEALNEVEPGTILDAVIKRVETYGAFIEVNRNFGGLVHVSQLSDEFVKNAADIVKIGDKVKVRYDGTDEQGRHNFSMKGLGLAK
ncbi:MAG: polyribonucleotide nucleotidyltransferase [bacterium]